MYLVMTNDDFNGLTHATKLELAALLGIPVSTDQDGLGISQNGDAEIEDLTIKTVKRFMAGVSEETASRLRVFAEKHGTTTWREIEGIAGEFHWAGFQSGVTRRLRTVTGDSDANFFHWDDTADDWKDCPVSVSEMTCDSLRHYFGM